MATDLLLFLHWEIGGVESNSILFESELALVTSPTEYGRNDFLRLLRLGQKKLSSRSFCPGLSEHSLWKF